MVYILYFCFFSPKFLDTEETIYVNCFWNSFTFCCIMLCNKSYPNSVTWKKKSFVLRSVCWLRWLCSEVWRSGSAYAMFVGFGSPPGATCPLWQAGWDTLLWPWRRMIPTAKHNSGPCLYHMFTSSWLKQLTWSNPKSRARRLTGSIKSCQRACFQGGVKNWDQYFSLPHTVYAPVFIEVMRLKLRNIGVIKKWMCGL